MTGYIPRTHWMAFAIRDAYPFDSMPDGAQEEAERLEIGLIIMESSCHRTLEEARAHVEAVPHCPPYHGIGIVPCGCAALVPVVNRERVN